MYRQGTFRQGCWGLPWWCGRSPGSPRVPRLAARQGLPGAGRPARRDQPSGAGPASQRGRRGALWPGSRPACWTLLPAPSNSTTPNARTYSTWHGPRMARARSSGPGGGRPSSGSRTRACSGPSTRSPRAPRSSATAGWTCSPRTVSRRPSTPRSTRPRNGLRTSLGSSSSTRPRTASTRTGTSPPTSASPSSAPKPAAARTTRNSTTCRRAVDAQRRVPHPVGRAQRPAPWHRFEEFPSPGRR